MYILTIIIKSDDQSDFMVTGRSSSQSGQRYFQRLPAKSSQVPECSRNRLQELFVEVYLVSLSSFT